MNFGTKLKEARMKAGYSQETLAQIVGVSRSAIAKWENNRGLADIENIKLISDVFNVSIDSLLDDKQELDFKTYRKSISLLDYTNKVTILNKKKIKDKIIKSYYPDANIYTLLGNEKLNRNEKLMDILIFLFTPFIDVIKLTKQLNHMDRECYLVEQNDKQYLVIVSDQYIESKEVENIKSKKFKIDNFYYMNCGLVK
jgi:transcriptional regulator with XRE-family HTH domain